MSAISSLLGNGYTLVNFIPEKATNGDVIVAKSLPTNVSYLVTHFEDIRDKGGYYAFSGRVNDIPRQFTLTGLSDDGVYQLKTVVESSGGISTKDAVIAAMGTGNSVSMSDEVTATTPNSNTTTHTKTLSQLNTVEEVAVSSLNGLIQNVKDVEPWNINSAKIKLLVNKSFDFAYEFLLRALEDRDYDPVTGSATDDPNNPDPNTGGNSGETPTPTYTTNTISTSKIDLYQWDATKSGEDKWSKITTYTYSNADLSGNAVLNDDGETLTLNMLDPDAEYEGDASDLFIKDKQIQISLYKGTLPYAVAYGGEEHPEYLTADFGLVLKNGGAAISTVSINPTTYIGDTYPIGLPGVYNWEIILTSDKPILAGNTSEKIGELRVAYPITNIVYDVEDSGDLSFDFATQTLGYRFFKLEIYLLKSTTSGNTMLYRSVKFRVAPGQEGEGSLLEEQD